MLRAFALAVLLPGAAWAEAACAPDRVDLRWDGGRESFAVEVADDGQERAQGLMFRTELASASGMLFVYDSPRRVSFWMKNTLIPLDMVFADPAGTVTRVHSGAVPGDLTPIDGGDGVQFVLEINAGLAEKLGIAPGTVMRHPAIPSETAAWSCNG
ncbi:DUF192 domain-containing protein [Tabrizicola sp.]|uniref:DUF192 domain-containing protein n=1 Tax=Tabrizicola sp. TaxID=2005166 RepID=UPI0027343B61|nr:DUF192 domain-containing protein [Tabrizicola sp.]MDP3196845.1 DUF192 domain-containing protein [Tabrizicola sp.]